jgi:hypothetical protein
MAIGVGALLLPPLLSAVLIRFERTGVRAPAEPVTSKAAHASPANGAAAGKQARSPSAPRCVRIKPSFFTLRPGGTQQLTADFEGSPGATRFTWSTTGGTLGEGEDEPTKVTMEGFIVTDDFDGDTIDEALWRASVPAGATLVQANGVLTMKQPGGGAPGQAIRLESIVPFQGNFAAEAQIVSVKADGIRGTGCLSFLTDDGYEPHVQRISETAVYTVEANTRGPDGRWFGATSVVDKGGPVKVRLLRGGATVGFQMEVPSTLVQMGKHWQPLTEASGRVVLASWSIDNAPAVTAVFDNFGAAQNVSVAWRAPPDAPVDVLYTIKIGDDCHATARISEH